MSPKQAKVDARNKADIDAYSQLHPEMQQLIQRWIAYKLRHATRYLRRRNSRVLTKDFKWAAGIHINDACFRGAMLVAGFTSMPADGDSEDRVYNAYRFPRRKSYDEISARRFIELKVRLVGRGDRP